MNKKILVAGDLEGNFQPLLSKLPSFDIAFCVGRTLALNDQTAQALRGEINFPKPVYFIDNGPLRHVLSIKYKYGSTLAPNFHYLGDLDIKSVAGLTVCFSSGDLNTEVDGKLDDNSADLVGRLNIHGEREIEKLLKDNSLLLENNEGVDILLTCQWPKHYGRFAESQDTEFNGLELIDRLAYKVKPRYHFCGNLDKYYERAPYINYDVKSQPIHCTRLIGVGKLPQPDCKATCKYLYAFSSQPLKSMTIEQIRERPEGSTENPYIAFSISRAEEAKQGNQIFTESQIFDTKYEVSEEEKAKINQITELVSLHVKGFSQ